MYEGSGVHQVKKKANAYNLQNDIVCLLNKQQLEHIFKKENPYFSTASDYFLF